MCSLNYSVWWMNAGLSEETGHSQKSLHTLIKSKSSVVVAADLSSFVFPLVATDFFFHCLADFPTLKYLAAFLPGSFCFTSFLLWSLECYGFCRLWSWSVRPVDKRSRR